MKKKIVIVDYKVGNTCSVLNALQALGYHARVSGKNNDIENADALVLPGVGSFSEAMGNLEKLGLSDVLNKVVLKDGKPILGICLGMQILTEKSEEAPSFNGLGWIPGAVKKIQSHQLRVPHVGWNGLEVTNEAPLFEKHEHESNYYFDHSYHFTCDKKYAVATCTYGDNLIAAVQKDNIFGVQFHPEKSHTNGLKLFRSFFNHFNF